jgi:hypothetical protein
VVKVVLMMMMMKKKRPARQGWRDGGWRRRVCEAAWKGRKKRKEEEVGAGAERSYIEARAAGTDC